MKSKTAVLVDFSNFCFACWYPAVSANKADAKYDTHAVFKNNIDGKLSTLFRTLNEVGTHDFVVYFVEDRKSLRKYTLWPTYKANRPPLEYDPRPEAKEYLRSKGYNHFVYSPDNEADDAIATIAASVLEDRDVVICSSDKDLWQLKRPGVDIWQLTKDRFVTDEMIVEEFGVSSPEYIPLVKALWGDRGDNVKNLVPRYQKALLPLIEISDGSLYDFERVVSLRKSELPSKCVALLTDNRSGIFINDSLVRLDTNCNIIDRETQSS